ncbi:hypothetical protein H8S23_11095 [Anaerofilum sp. BX8]|uniref:N-acetyltransferase domain-containing protein n=1 Tax=Anaerofilum hominis TaxID=2763016 RepID=A0A923L1H7_9FIRM|nr:hypothetical protein [Anaerofilum hominis]MBC5582052.1 hypothetical protein [Anaerofilum hominis]
MSGYRFRRAAAADRGAIIEFMNLHWGSRHPLVNLPDYFTYYYQNGDPDSELLNFALCLEDERIAALCGFIPSSRDGREIWVSIWCADKKAKGSGLELMSQLPALTGAERMSCNNIRPNTIPFYEFLGYTGARMGHFYRLSPRREYLVAQVADRTILPVSGSGFLKRFETFEELKENFVPPQNAHPFKDLWYLERRYFHYPRQSYLVYGGFLDSSCPLLFCLRKVSVKGTYVLRLVDIVGELALLPCFGNALNALLAESAAEYMDCYCWGISAQTMAAAGLCERTENSANIIPHYLVPPLIQNVEYYLFTSDPQGFVMFRADGDQDRPNIEC